MKTFSKLLILIGAIGTFIACEKSSSSSTLSSVAQITAFAFEANDSFPGLAEAQFVIKEESDMGLIRMRTNDSVRYGTPINRVVPSISYYTTPSAVTFYLGDSAVALTGYDTLDLTIQPIKIHVIAQDTEYDKWYELQVNVHQVDGEHFQWSKFADIPNTQKSGMQKAIMRKDTFYYYQNDGSGVEVHKAVKTSFATDSTLVWTKHTVTGLPKTCDVRQIVEGDKFLFYGKGHTIYASADGCDWISTAVDSINIVALYMSMHVNNMYDQNDSVRIWMAAEDKHGDMRFYTVGTDLNLHEEKGIGLSNDILPETFPIEEYATIPFQSSSLHQHALIAGGYDRNGHMTNARWSLEYNYIYNQYHLTNMASDNALAPFAGSSISYYGSFIYLLGGVSGSDRSYIKNAHISWDEGVHWTEVTDTINPKRPVEFTGRNHVNSFVHPELTEKGDTLHYLYIIGGEDNSTTYSDVYRGYLISVDWPEIGD